MSLLVVDWWVAARLKLLRNCHFLSASGSSSLMAAPFVPKELFAICTCCLIAARSSRASFLSSVSDSGLNWAPQRQRILVMISSIRASVEDGTAIF